MATKPAWLGVDTGGTFTDFVYFDGKKITIHKVLSTPREPEKAILQGLDEMGIGLDKLKIIHGSTVATNAVLESRGVKTLYITNLGFKDVMHIGRQARPELYRLQIQPRSFFIDENNCLEIDCRISAQGEQLQAIDITSLKKLSQQVTDKQPQAVAINCLFSFLDNRHEKQIAASLPDNIFISCSSDVLPEYREYERGMATCLNAYVGPLMQQYLRRLQKNIQAADLSIMQSSGGTINADHAGQYAVSLLLSGPAGGLKAAQFVAALSGRRRLLSFDMGGTSTDVALIDGEITLTSEGKIGPYPVPLAMVDMHTIGAGGGSIVRIDEAGMLHVGPESAGADPGPACYGKGRMATVTDANLVLGHLPELSALGGCMRLDLDAAKRALDDMAQLLKITIEQLAEGVIKIANEHMVAALRVISVQRGLEPNDFDLVSFGGAGGLHVCALADALQMKRAIVPIHGGVLSALGMLVARPSRNVSRTMTSLIKNCDEEKLKQAFDKLIQTALLDMKNEVSANEISIKRTLDCRYKGQSFTLNINWQDLACVGESFHQLHQQRYGHQLNMDIELVNIRVQLSAPATDFFIPDLDVCNSNKQGLICQNKIFNIEEEVDVYQRELLGSGQKIHGPALLLEKNSTTYIENDWKCEVAECGSLMLSRD